MRKTLTNIALFLMIAQISKAQTDIRYGAEAGLTSTTLAVKVANYGGTTISEATTFKRGGLIGGLAEAVFNDHYAAQVGVYIAGKGASGYGINYLEIPLLMERKFGKGYGFNVYAGPYFDFAMSTSGDVMIGTPEVNSDKLGIKAFDFGAKFGLGYQLRMGLFLRAGYEIGVTNIASTDLNGEKISNACFFLSMGYLFPGKYYFY